MALPGLLPIHRSLEPAVEAMEEETVPDVGHVRTGHYGSHLQPLPTPRAMQARSLLQAVPEGADLRGGEVVDHGVLPMVSLPGGYGGGTGWLEGLPALLPR